MRNKWFLGSLIVILAFIGISLEQNIVPNQEIIIKFSQEGISHKTAIEAIARVQSELEKIEASNINIEKSANGILKITYYSDIAVADVKKIFSKSALLGQRIRYTSQNDKENLPPDTDVENYYLDVFKIQDNNDLDGQMSAISESKSDTTRSSSINGHAYLKKPSTPDKKNIEQVAYQVYFTCALAIDTTSHKIPEVRAGPLS